MGGCQARPLRQDDTQGRARHVHPSDGHDCGPHIRDKPSAEAQDRAGGGGVVTEKAGHADGHTPQMVLLPHVPPAVWVCRVVISPRRLLSSVPENPPSPVCRCMSTDSRPLPPSVSSRSVPRAASRLHAVPPSHRLAS